MWEDVGRVSFTVVVEKENFPGSGVSCPAHLIPFRTLLATQYPLLIRSLSPSSGALSPSGPLTCCFWHGHDVSCCVGYHERGCIKLGLLFIMSTVRNGE